MVAESVFRFGQILRAGTVVFAIAFGLVPASSLAQTGGQGSLKDLELRMVEAVQNEYYQDFLTYLSEYERRGGTVVPDMIYYKAVALESSGDILGAFDEVDRFLASVTGSHPKFPEARTMIQDLAEKAPPIRALITRLASARNNSEELTILRDYVRENQYLSYRDTRYAERQIGVIEGPLTVAASHWRFEAMRSGDPIEGAIHAMAFNRDGSVLALGAGGIWPSNIFITDAEDGRHILSSIYEYAQPIWNTRTSMTISPADDLLVLGMQDGRISFFRYGEGAGFQFNLKAPTLKEVNPIMLSEIDPVEEISFSSDGSRVATLHASRTVIVYDVENRKAIWTFLLPEQNGINYFIALSPDGKKILTSGEQEASLWDVERQMGLFSIKTSYVQDVAFAPDGQSFMIVDSNLKVYDAATGDLLRRHSVGSSYGRIATSPTGRYLHASSGNISRDSKGRVYDQPAEIRVYQPDGSLSAILRGIGGRGECRQDELEFCRHIAAVAMSSEGKLVAAATSDGYLRFWRLP